MVWRVTWRALTVAVIMALVPFPTSASPCGKSRDADYVTKKKYLDRFKEIAQPHAFKITLEETHKAITRHENQHLYAAGKWADKPYFYYYKFNGKLFAITGCALFKAGIPLDVLVKVDLAPEEPSEKDWGSAVRICVYMKKKKMPNIPVVCLKTKRLYNRYKNLCEYQMGICRSYKEIEVEMERATSLKYRSF